MKPRPPYAPLSILVLVALLASSRGFAVERFPPPEFETRYELPPTPAPSSHSTFGEYLDVAALVVALSLASWLSLRLRSRRWITWLGIASLAWFGFWREGCVCAIGATQNVTLALFDPSYRAPLVAIIFFLLPLAFTLFFGRGFCAAVCPLGAIQDVVLVRPVHVPPWIERPLRLFRHVYLALAVLLAATGTAFVICRYDPFVGFFRLSGPTSMLLLGGLLLLIGVFVGRPYCRYLCPYSVLLGIAGRFSRARVTITPRECTRCRLCENSCPFAAIDRPTPPASGELRRQARRRLGRLLVSLPLLVAAGVVAGSWLGVPLSRLHPDVEFAEALHRAATKEAKTDSSPAGPAAKTSAPKNAAAASSEPEDQVRAVTKTGESLVEIRARAAGARARVVRGSRWFGAWIGLVLALELIRLSRLPRRRDYEADRAHCLACGRCYEYCPEEHERRKVEWEAPRS